MCVFCDNGCDYCQPENNHLPDWFIPSKARPTQTENVVKGLHPMGLRLLNAGIGETCGNCAHLKKRQYNSTYYKCDLNPSHSQTTDIRLKWAGCEKWGLNTNQ
jgi:hypothetical protein